MSSSSVSPRTPSLPSAAAPNTDVSALMPNHPPSLKFHIETRHTDSCKPYRLHCILLTDFGSLSFSTLTTRLTGLVWGLTRDADQQMTDVLRQYWDKGKWWCWRSKCRCISVCLMPARFWNCVNRLHWDSAGGFWIFMNFMNGWSKEYWAQHARRCIFRDWCINSIWS